MKLLELFETEDTDQVYRLEAREAADKIQAWLSAHGQSAYKKFKKSANGISLPASSFDLPYTNLTIFLSKGEDSGSYGTFNADRDKKFIQIKMKSLN